MKQKLLCLFIVLLSLLPLYSDNRTPQYEYWGDDYFNQKNKDSSYNVDSMQLIFGPELSTGFFPHIPYPLIFSLIKESNGWDYSSGSFLVNDIFPKNQNKFFAQVGNDDILDAMKEEKKPFSDDDKYGWFNEDRSRNNFDLGIRLEYSFPALRTSIVADIGIKTRYVTAFSSVRIGEYIDYDGNKCSLKQISFAEINDQHIYFDVMLKHPLYGFSFNSPLTNGQMISTGAMFYYLVYGVNVDYSYFDKMNIYEYILSDQNTIRFTNGEIREASLFKQNFDRIDKIRYYYNIGFGWQGAFSNIYINFELLYKQSINPIIKDSDYKHKILTVRVGIPFSIASLILWSIL